MTDQEVETVRTARTEPDDITIDNSPERDSSAEGRPANRDRRQGTTPDRVGAREANKARNDGGRRRGETVVERAALTPGGVMVGYDDDGDYVRIPREPSPALRGLLALFVILVLLALAGLWAKGWVDERVDGPGLTGETIVVEVPEGSGIVQMADRLEEAGVITNSLMFQGWVRLDDDRSAVEIQAGTYEMSLGNSFQGALDELSGTALPPPFIDVTVQEGLRLEEITAELGAGLPAVSDQSLNWVILGQGVRSRYMNPEPLTGELESTAYRTLEGYLFPDTYQFDAGAEPVAVLQRMIDRFDEVGREVGLDTAKETTGYEAHEIVTIASLIEEEAAIEEDRAKIARVIYNRLERGTPLGIDAAIIYGVYDQRILDGVAPEEADATGGLTVTELETDGPFNTRTRTGLPPTAISNPGRASLEAALAPAEGDWIYYVLKDCQGGHLFTASVDEFESQKASSEASGIFDGSGCAGG